MNPPTTLTNHNPPATIGCGLNPNPIRREESDTPHLAEDGTHLDAVATQFKLVTAAACATHGLPPQSPTTTRRPRRPARARWTPQMNATASAQRMPPIPPRTDSAGPGVPCRGG